MSRFEWRHQYDEDRDEYERLGTDIVCEDESLTQQQFKADADINVLVRRFGITDGAIPPAVVDPAYFGDFSDEVDFRTALDRTRDAIERFEALPAELRNRFGNDPVALYSFVSDEKNAEEAVSLGLLKKRAPEASQAAPSATPPAPAPAPVSPPVG